MSTIDQLRVASRNGDSERVKELIGEGADIHERDALGWSALHRSAANGHVAVMQALIDADAEIDSEENIGRTALYLACQNGLLPAVNMLIDLKADVNRPRKNGRSPLYAAAANGILEVVKALVNAGATVDQTSHTGCSPLYAASQEGHAPVVEELIRAGADAGLMGNDGTSPLHVASWCDRDAVIHSLIKAKVNVNAKDLEGQTPLQFASIRGHLNVIQILIDAGADVNEQDENGTTPLFAATSVLCESAVQILLANGARPQIESRSPPFSPLQVACFVGSVDIAKIILQQSPGAVECLPASCAALAADYIAEVLAKGVDASELELSPSGASDTELSSELHEQFNKAGFNCKMSAIQSACADVMQEIEQKRRNWPDIYVVGSFSEGWGNSLSSLIGKTDVESDIDVAEFFPGRMYHLSGRCKDQNANPEDIVEYENGHVIVSASTSNPAQNETGSYLRPAFDFVTAFRCSSYPQIEVLDNPSRKTHLSATLIESLKKCVRESNCHLVTAAPPGHAGKLLRVSTTFLERLMMRSLNNVQGQVFILLKYLIKKVITVKVKGLKTYHAKCLLFYLLDGTEAAEWQPQNLVELTRRALQQLLRNLQMCESKSSEPKSCEPKSSEPKSCEPKSSEPKSSEPESGECMRHFFMQDAIVYLKSGHSSKDEIAETVTHTIKNLTRHLTRFKDMTLKPLDSQPPTFYFHPFVNIPWIRMSSTTASATMEYHEIYESVRETLVLLSREDSVEQLVTDTINRLPDCAKTVRETLRAIAFVKFNKRDEAASVLRCMIGHSVSKRISAVLPRGQSAKDHVWHHLRNNDSAWKFCFFITERPTFAFLNEFICDLFPVTFMGCAQYFYFNFDAMKKCLILHFIGDAFGHADAWFKEVEQSADTDVQELVMVMQHCRDIQLLLSIFRKHRIVIIDHEVSREKLLMLMEELPELRETRCQDTLTELRNAS